MMRAVGLQQFQINATKNSSLLHERLMQVEVHVECDARLSVQQLPSQYQTSMVTNRCDFQIMMMSPYSLNVDKSHVFSY